MLVSEIQAIIKFAPFLTDWPGGSFLSNGSMISMSGNDPYGFGDSDGHLSVRIFNNCNDAGCSYQEYPATVRLSSPRWYVGTARLQDGSLIAMGGMAVGA